MVTGISETRRKLLERYEYVPSTGKFIRLHTHSHFIKGEAAGSVDREGYTAIRINGTAYFAHRLVWLYVHGYFPENLIDHINGERSDNRLKNLREVSLSCNLRNCGNGKRNKSGVKGVHFYKKYGKWMASIGYHGKAKSLGYYDDFNDAVCARYAAEQCLDWEKCGAASPAKEYVEAMLS